jgi:hypothetical protein
MEKEEAEEKEASRKAEKERYKMKYKVGDKVRVRRDLEEYGQYGKYGANRNMAELHGSIVEIKKVENEKQRYEINDNLYYWTDEMFEGLVEDELTAEEATKILSEICCENELCGGCPISEAKGKMTCQSFRRDKTEEVLEILKRWKKDHEKKEVEVESKLYCRIIDGGDGLTVRSEALQDGINLNDEIKEILAKYCSEHVGDYFALCEKRWMVKQ